MAWRKSPPELIDRFERLFPADPAAQRRLMFGYPAGFVNGNMFAGLWQEFLVLRLADAARHELLKLPGTRVFEPVPGRPMREYVCVTPAILDDDKTLARWLGRALAYASALPAKKPRPPRKPAAPGKPAAGSRRKKKPV